MNITLQRQEVLEGLNSGAITERYVFSGRDVIFSALGEVCRFRQFELVVHRPEPEAIPTVALDLRGLDRESLLLVASAVLLPISARDFSPLLGAHLLLVLKREHFTSNLLGKLNPTTDLAALLAACTAEGAPVIFELNHYDAADLAGF